MHAIDEERVGDDVADMHVAGKRLTEARVEAGLGGGGVNIGIRLRLIAPDDAVRDGRVVHAATRGCGIGEDGAVGERAAVGAAAVLGFRRVVNDHAVRQRRAVGAAAGIDDGPVSDDSATSRDPVVNTSAIVGSLVARERAVCQFRIVGATARACGVVVDVAEHKRPSVGAAAVRDGGIVGDRASRQRVVPGHRVATAAVSRRGVAGDHAVCERSVVDAAAAVGPVVRNRAAR